MLQVGKTGFIIADIKVLLGSDTAQGTAAHAAGNRHNADAWAC